jgi:EmrB/QacA subfamily drug resistance transporter
MSSESGWKRQLAFAIVCIAQFMVVLDAAIMNVALPTIQTSLHVSEADLPWIVNGYTLIFGGFLLLGGRSADLLGRRRVFMAGLVLFGGASLVGGFAQNTLWLVIARGFEGLGGAIISPASLAIIYTMFQGDEERNRALGIWGALGGLGAACGGLLGGVLTDSLGWEWVLFVNVPIAAIAVVLIPMLLEESHIAGRVRELDLPGAATVTSSLLLLVYAVLETTNNGWASPVTIGCLAGSAVLMAIFITIETKVAAPLVPLRIFRINTVRTGDIVAAFAGAGIFPFFYFVTLYMQQVLGYSALKTGFAFLPFSVTLIICSILVSRVLGKVGVKQVLVGALFVMAAGLYLMAPLEADWGYLNLLLPLELTAVGFGVSIVPLTIAALSGLHHAESGLGSGLLNASRQVAGAVGLSILAAVAASRTGDLVSGGEAPRVALSSGFSTAFIIAASFVVAAGVFALVLLHPQRPAESEAEAKEAQAEPAATGG